MKALAALLVTGLALFSNNAAEASQVQDTLILGKLYFVNVKEREQPVMTALSLFGDRCGSDDFNKKPFSADGIRSVFELNEYQPPQTHPVVLDCRRCAWGYLLSPL